MIVEIKNGKAVEVNPYGAFVEETGHSDNCHCDKCENIFNRWEQAEKERKVYKIENSLTDGWIPTYNDPDNAGCHPMAEPRFEEGTIHEAEIINETTVKIL